MNEVTNQNFKNIYPQLERALKNASFVAIDAEFTGIQNDNIKNSLFDCIQERYDKNRNSIRPYIIIQFGVTAFRRLQDENKYTAEPYNFFLLPRSFPSKHREFLWQVSALEFLATYGFDFNKVAYHGISYLDETDQATLQQHLQENALLCNVERYMTYKEQDDLKLCSAQVAEWLNSANDETNSFKINTPSPLLQYLVHKELREHFPNVWTLSGNDTITVMKVPKDVREVLEKEEGSILEDTLLESYIGFTKVFKLLVTLKKPIIAHNVLLDLMFIHQQFYKPLPWKYTDFKNNIHQLFPIIYDTKFLSYRLGNTLYPEEKWNIKFSSLSNLFEYFTHETKCLTLGSPAVKLIHLSNDADNDADVDTFEIVANDRMYHTAGWDAYFTGFIFIKMAHAFAIKQYGQGGTLKYFTHTELMSSVKDFANCINVSRGNILHSKLDGPEPASTRPQWLYVKTLASKPINAAQIADMMSKFGTVDVKQFTSRRVLVAVANHGSARDILQHFTQHKELHVVPYSVIRHSPSVQLALWSSIIVSGGIVAWMLHQKLQKTS